MTSRPSTPNSHVPVLAISAPVVSVVIVTREGFAKSAERLMGLLEATTYPFKLIYVNGAAPYWISRKLRRIVREHGGALVRSNRFLRPTQARNLGYREVDTPYVVFIDNDVLVTEQWLARLVECAEETQADYVSPVVRQHVNGKLKVHIAGGANRIAESGSGRHFEETYAHMHSAYGDVAGTLDRRKVSMAEFHTLLIRTETLDSIGGLDECCSTAFEHNDFCLSVAGAGGAGWLEPRAIVDYAPDSAGLYGNLSYGLLRWCRSWIEESHEGFCAKWGVSPHDSGFSRDLRSLHGRRRRGFRYVRSALRRVGGSRMVSLFDSAADWAVNVFLRPYHESTKLKVSVDRW